MPKIIRSDSEFAEMYSRALAASHLGDEHDERDDYAEGALAVFRWLTGDGSAPEFATAADYD